MTTKYQMWLTHNAEAEKIQLPVLPEKFSVKNGSNNESLNVTGLGEVVIMQSRPALQFSFSSFFPAAKFPGIGVDSITPPLMLVQTINEWKASTEPIHFICTAVGVDLYCTIESFSYEEDGGDVGTYQYSLTLKEYREITMRQVTIEAPKTTAAVTTVTASVQKTETRVNNTVTAKTYTVVKGDCLYNIAKKLYGDGSKWKTIYNANKSIIGSNPNLIYPGQVYTIP